MRTGTDCLACFMQQALNVTKLCTEDPQLQRQLLVDVGAMLGTFPEDSTPPENAAHYYRLIAESTRVADPFAEIKKQSNDFALSLENKIRDIVEQAADPLLAALRFAIGANVLDNGAQKQLDIKATLAQCQQQQFAIDHYSWLRDKLATSRKVLLLADNCGEIVFDKLLVQQLLVMGLEVVVAVRGMPIINDATLEDAKYCGMDNLCRVVANGSDLPGTSLEQCTDEFRDLFAAADCILSKGMGNFECLSDINAPIVFLFTVKCSTVLHHLKGLYSNAPLQVGSPVIVAPSVAV